MRKIYSQLKKGIQIIHNKRQLKKVNIGIGCNVFGNIDIVNPKNVTIGNYCSINHGSYINATNKVALGNDVTLSAGSKIISTGIDYYKWINGNKCHTKNDGIFIGDHVWVGSNAQILENVKITGEYVIVAANAVVTNDINDSYVIVAGCPAKIIKKIV